MVYSGKESTVCSTYSTVEVNIHILQQVGLHTVFFKPPRRRAEDQSNVRTNYLSSYSRERERAVFYFYYYRPRIAALSTSKRKPLLRI